MSFTLVFALLFGLASASVPETWLGTAEVGSRVINGLDAKEGEFPYMASLRRKQGKHPGHRCGASIITKQWILSAAHCCEGMTTQNDHIYIGSALLSGRGTNNTISKIILHGAYNPSNLWANDICLLRLQSPLTFSDKVQQVTIATPDWPINSGDRVTISGWGGINPITGEIPDNLQKSVNFTAYNNDECGQKTNTKILPGHICAVGPTREHSTWNGDSGGPLVKNRIQIGLTSFGFRPFGEGMPTVYTRVPYYLNWIIEKLGPDAKDLKIQK